MRGPWVAFIAVVAFCVAASCAAAATTPFELSRADTRATLVPGEAFSSLLTRIGGSGNGTMTVKTPSYTLSCSSGSPGGRLAGTVLTNNLPTDTVRMEAAVGVLNGSEDCSSSSPPKGSDEGVRMKPNDAILSLSGVDGQAELAATSATEPIVLEILEFGTFACGYSTPALTGSLTLEPVGAGSFQKAGYRRIAIHFENQRMRQSSGPINCPEEVTLDLPFESQGAPISETSDYFIYGRIAQPTVTKLAPSKGSAAPGTAVTITGTNFYEVSAVDFGSAAASYTVNSKTSITAIAPAEEAGKVPVTVTTAGGTTKAKPYEYVPIISSLMPSSGPAGGGTSVGVTGAGFRPGATAFKFGTTPAASVECSSSTQCTVVSPAHAAGKVNVVSTVNSIHSANSPANRYVYF